MRTTLVNKIEINDGVEIKIDGNIMSVKGPNGELTRSFAHPAVKIVVEGKEVILTSPSLRKAKKMANTFRAHIENMIKGVTEGFEYELKICSGHFPMNVSKEGNKIVIKNFLGEKVPRESKILEGVEANIEQDVISVKGISIELVGQTAANIEQSTKVRNRDRRRFQDGIFITSKRGKLE